MGSGTEGTVYCTWKENDRKKGEERDKDKETGVVEAQNDSECIEIKK